MECVVGWTLIAMAGVGKSTLPGDRVRMGVVHRRGVCSPAACVLMSVFGPRPECPQPRDA